MHSQTTDSCKAKATKVANFDDAVKIFRGRIRSSVVLNNVSSSYSDANANNETFDMNPNTPVPSNLRFDSDWLRHLHKEHHARFLADNNRIWVSAQILIPASLVPFAALASFREAPTHTVVSIFALVSTTLIVFWHVIAETHKAFQQKSLAWMIAIEEEIGLITKDTPQRVYSGDIKDSIFLVRKDILPHARQTVVLLVLIAWFAVLVLFQTHV